MLTRGDIVRLVRGCSMRIDRCSTSSVHDEAALPNRRSTCSWTATPWRALVSLFQNARKYW